MPATIEDLVKYWRFGCPLSFGTPVKNFHTAKFRKENVNGYTDKKWRSGQRQLFQRHTNLIKIVAKCVDPPISDIFGDETPEELWIAAIENFNSHWLSIPLTRVLNHSSKLPSSTNRGKCAASTPNIAVKPLLSDKDENIEVPRTVEREENERFNSLNPREQTWFDKQTGHIKGTREPVDVHGANICLKSDDLSRFRGQEWINDEVVNSFAFLVNYRNRDYFRVHTQFQENQNAQLNTAGDMDYFWERPRPRTFMFNSYFFERLTSSESKYDYSGVRNWPKQAGIEIASLDLILIPVNLKNSHWVLALIDLRSYKFLYLDSMHGADNYQVLSVLQAWFGDELKSNNSLAALARQNVSEWPRIVNPHFVPRQTDSGSCGIFMLYLADYLELGRKLDFSQEHMPILRKRMLFFLARNRLADHPE